MKLIFKRALTAASFAANGLFILLLVYSGFSKTSFVSYPDPGAGFVAASAVVCLPEGARAAFNAVEFELRPGQKCFIQFSAVADGRQGNVPVNALYDPEIISVSPAPGGAVEITALAPGSTLVQSFGVNGVSDIALVTVAE